MADFFIKKIDKSKYPEVVKAHGGRTIYMVYYDRGVIPYLVGKTFTVSKARKMANNYSLKRLHTKAHIELVK